MDEINNWFHSTWRKFQDPIELEKMHYEKIEQDKIKQQVKKYLL